MASIDKIPDGSELSKHWNLSKEIVYLNHGSFGATPSEVLNKQQFYINETESQAVDFFVNKLPALYNDSRKTLANFVGTSFENLVFTPNTTTGVNTILSNLKFSEGDEWLTTSHAYGACINAFNFYAAKNKCNVVVAEVPFPLKSSDEVIAAIEKSITSKTKVALIDHITSATALIFPVKEIITLLKQKNILVIIDGAHAPGYLELNIDNLNPNFYVGNCHKWICSPKGSAFLWVNEIHQQLFSPIVISHFNDSELNTKSHWSNQFFWDGTHDYSAYICVKDAIEFMSSLDDDGWKGIQEKNRNLALKSSKMICDLLNKELPAPESMLGAMVCIAMPDGDVPTQKFNSVTKLKRELTEKYKIEVPIFNFPSAPTQWLRISAQLYNNFAQYQYLITSLSKCI